MFKVDFTSGVHKARSPALRATKRLHVLPNILPSITLDFSFCYHFGANNFEAVPILFFLICVPLLHASLCFKE